jgi:hypothetical protein
MPLNFVAVDDGVEDDPKLLALAQALKVPRSTAFWWWFRWNRLIVHKGNHLSGSLPKTYGAVDIAAFLEFRGSARRLIDAMKKHGWIVFKKGRGFSYPSWTETTTGRYAHRREGDRLYRERQRADSRASAFAQSDDVGRQSADTQADGRATSTRQSEGRNQGRISDLPPDPPPSGGDSVADARWEWLNQHAPTPQDRDFCKKRLASMSEEDWGLVTRSYGLLSEPGASISKKNRRALHWSTDAFLRKQGYLRFRVRERPTRTTATRRDANGASSPITGVEKRLAESDAFILELLEDPEVSAETKEAWRERWCAKPENQGRQPPWDRREQGVS